MGEARVYLNGVQVGTATTHRDAHGVLVISEFDPHLAPELGDVPAMSFGFRVDATDTIRLETDRTVPGVVLTPEQRARVVELAQRIRDGELG